MNQKDIIANRRETWFAYHLPGGSNLNRVKKNAVFVSAANKKDDYIHEFCKAAVAITLKRLGKDFICECVNNRSNLRHDLVCLDSGNIWEIETESTRAKRFEQINNKKIIVVCVEGLDLKAAVDKTVKTVEDNE